MVLEVTLLEGIRWKWHLAVSKAVDKFKHDYDTYIREGIEDVERICYDLCHYGKRYVYKKYGMCYETINRYEAIVIIGKLQGKHDFYNMVLGGKTWFKENN